MAAVSVKRSIAKNYSQPNFPHPSLDGILVHHSIVPNGMKPFKKKKHKIKDLWEER